LLQVEDILEQRHFPEQQTMTNAVATENSSRQVICVASLSSMWTQQESIEAALLPPEDVTGLIANVALLSWIFSSAMSRLLPAGCFGPVVLQGA